MPFPNLPYLIDTSGGSRVCLSQSNAILRYLARRFNFYGGSESERIEIDVLQDEAYDFRNEIINTVYTSVENYASVFEQFSTNIVPRYLNSFETY
jgi:glutathione S-transferase